MLRLVDPDRVIDIRLIQVGESGRESLDPVEATRLPECPIERGPDRRSRVRSIRQLRISMLRRRVFTSAQGEGRREREKCRK